MYTKPIEEELDKWEWHIAGANRYGVFDFDHLKLLVEIWQALYFATHSRHDKTDLYKEGTDDLNLLTFATEALGFLNPYADRIKRITEDYNSEEIYVLRDKLRIALEEVWRVDRRRTNKAFRSVHEICMRLKVAVVKEWAFLNLKDPITT